jgi:hypothetical protein
MLKPAGQTTLTEPPGVSLVANAQAAKRTRLAPIRVCRVGAPPLSTMSNVRVMARVAPALSRLPKSMRSRVWSFFRVATETRGLPVADAIL